MCSDLIATVEVILLGEAAAELDAGEATIMGNAWRFTAGILIPIGTALTVVMKVVDTSGFELERRTPPRGRITWERRAPARPPKPVTEPYGKTKSAARRADE